MCPRMDSPSRNPLCTFQISSKGKTTGLPFPVSLGVPFPQEATSGNDGYLLRLQNLTLPVQTRCLSHWPDGSARWLLLDTVVPWTSNALSANLYEAGENQDARPGTDALDTAVQENANILRQILHSPEFERHPTHDLIGWFVSAQGCPPMKFTTSADPVFDEVGRIRQQVCLRGQFADPEGKRLLEGIVRIDTWTELPLLRIQTTLVNTHPEAVAIDAVELRLPLPDAGTSGRIEQRSWNELACEPEDVLFSREYTGAPILTCDGVAAALRDFRGNHPCALAAEDGCLRAFLRPAWAGPLRYGGGAAKTHCLWVAYGNRAAETVVGAASDPIAVCDPLWYEQTGIFGPLGVAYGDGIDHAVVGELERRREKAISDGVHGLVHWGDSDFYTHGEQEIHGVFLFFARTGVRDVFDGAARAARHGMDLDIHHTDDKHRGAGVGHPIRSGAQASPNDTAVHSDSYAEYLSHTWLDAFWDLHFLTGDPRAREVALEASEFLLAHREEAILPGRDAARVMEQLCAAFEATGRPDYRDAAVEVAESVLKHQLPDGSFFSVYEGSGGGKRRRRALEYDRGPFFSAILLEGLLRVADVSDLPDLRQAVLDCVDFCICEGMDDRHRAFRFGTTPGVFRPDNLFNANRYHNASPFVGAMMLAPLAAAFRWTEDTDYLEIARTVLSPEEIDVHHLKGIPPALALFADESDRRGRIEHTLNARKAPCALDAREACITIDAGCQQATVDLTRGGRVVRWRASGIELVPDEREHDVRAGLCCDLLDGRRFAGAGRLLCTTRTRAFELLDVADDAGGVSVKMGYQEETEVGTIRIERRLHIYKNTPGIRISTALENAGATVTSIAPGFSNLINLAPLSNHPDEREAVAYLCRTHTPEGWKIHDLRHPTIHFDLAASGLAQTDLTLGCEATNLGIRIETRSPDLEKFYIHVWNPVDVCLIFSPRDVPSGQRVDVEYEIRPVTDLAPDYD